MRFINKFSVAALFISCTCSSIFGEDEYSKPSWTLSEYTRWVCRAIINGNWDCEFSEDEREQRLRKELVTAIVELEDERSRLKKEVYMYLHRVNEYKNEEADLQMKIVELKKQLQKYSFMQDDFKTRQKKLDLMHSEQEKEMQSFEKEAENRKEMLRMTWANFLKTTAGGNELFSHLIAGAEVPFLLSIEQKVYGSTLSKKENEVFMGKVLQYGNDWQNRPLKRAYAVVYVKKLEYKNMGEEELMTTQALFALDVSGKRELLAILDEECLSEQLAVSIPELRNHHVREIYLICLPNREDLQLTLQKSYPDSELHFLSPA
jgi:hypothetical protein